MSSQPATRGEALAQAYIELETLPVEEAARRAYTPGGPSLDELIRRINVRRGIDTRQTA